MKFLHCHRELSRYTNFIHVVDYVWHLSLSVALLLLPALESMRFYVPLCLVLSRRNWFFLSLFLFSLCRVPLSLSHSFPDENKNPYSNRKTEHRHGFNFKCFPSSRVCVCMLRDCGICEWILWHKTKNPTELKIVHEPRNRLLFIQYFLTVTRSEWLKHKIKYSLSFHSLWLFR